MAPRQDNLPQDKLTNLIDQNIWPKVPIPPTPTILSIDNGGDNGGEVKLRKYNYV